MSNYVIALKCPICDRWQFLMEMHLDVDGLMFRTAEDDGLVMDLQTCEKVRDLIHAVYGDHLKICIADEGIAFTGYFGEVQHEEE